MAEYTFSEAEVSALLMAVKAAILVDSEILLGEGELVDVVRRDRVRAAARDRLPVLRELRDRLEAHI